GVERIDPQGGIPAHLGEGRAARGDDGGAARHRLEDGETEALVQRGQNEAGGARVEVAQVALRRVPLEADSVAESERLHTLAHRLRVRRLTVTPDDQARGAPAAEDGEGVEQA